MNDRDDREAQLDYALEQQNFATNFARGLLAAEIPIDRLDDAAILELLELPATRRNLAVIAEARSYFDIVWRSLTPFWRTIIVAGYDSRAGDDLVDRFLDRWPT